MADAQSPQVTMTAMLERLIDDAMSRQSESARQRAEQLEVYRASGYPEHHPDYPAFP